MKKLKRNKLSFVQITAKFPTDEIAEQWFIDQRWENGVICPCCGSKRITERKTKKRSWRCKDCLKDFSTKTKSMMQGSNLGFRIWAIAIYLMTTSVKGIASTKLASNLGITQKSAWHLAMRIREAYNSRLENMTLSGIVEVDETYIGDKENNKHEVKKRHQDRGSVGKKAIIGAKQRNGYIVAQAVNHTDHLTCHDFINKHVKIDSLVVTDEYKSSTGLENHQHQTVCHSVGEYVNGQVHTNGIESFWALLKRGYYGGHHSMSHTHLDR